MCGASRRGRGNFFSVIPGYSRKPPISLPRGDRERPTLMDRLKPRAKCIREKRGGNNRNITTNVKKKTVPEEYSGLFSSGVWALVFNPYRPGAANDLLTETGRCKPITPNWNGLVKAHPYALSHNGNQVCGNANPLMHLNMVSFNQHKR